MITKEDVEHIGWLARIEINEQETVEYMEKLNSVLEYFGQLDELPTEDVPPTYHVADISGSLMNCQLRILLLHTMLLRFIMYSGRMWWKSLSLRKLSLQTQNTNRMGLSGSQRLAEEMF